MMFTRENKVDYNKYLYTEIISFIMIIIFIISIIISLSSWSSLLYFLLSNLLSQNCHHMFFWFTNYHFRISFILFICFSIHLLSGRHEDSVDNIIIDISLFLSNNKEQGRERERAICLIIVDKSGKVEIVGMGGMLISWRGVFMLIIKSNMIKYVRR